MKDVCRVCQGTLRLLDVVCPLCDGDPLFCSAKAASTKRSVWEFQNGAAWGKYSADELRMMRYAEAKGIQMIQYAARDYLYCIDLKELVQMNVDTGGSRKLRRIEEECEEECPRSERLVQLVDCLLSPAVQVPLPVEASEEPAKLSEAEVIEVFKTHVPGVEKFPYRDIGQYAITYIPKGYLNGLPAFHNTEMHNHLLWLLRLIVHYGHAGKVGASRYLRDVAEAFMDCQAIQARVIERVGLEIRGVRADFPGMITSFVGDYKTMAMKMLAAERVAGGRVADDGNPTHYENRLTADLGNLIGLNADDVRRAELDEHARNRFDSLQTPELNVDLDFAVERCKQLFDIEALLKALRNELNSFSSSTSSDSLPRVFLDWASKYLRPKHILFDEATCMKVDVGDSLVLATLETLFLGKVAAPIEDMYRGHRLRDMFVDCEEPSEVGGPSAEKNEARDPPAEQEQIQDVAESNKITTGEQTKTQISPTLPSNVPGVSGKKKGKKKN